MQRAALIVIPGLVAVGLILVTEFVKLPFWLLAVLWIIGFLIAMFSVLVIELKIRMTAIKRHQAEQDKTDKQELK
ncbi:Hypothetical protein ADU72_1885 [Pediococcus damnosus]|uniref:Integral membrane protein n=1 Tax=Pediococcus damnosus TaxID=51663 RepID=A0A0R2HLM1_9LACO|nr:hypothetical protein [Pediococcus damnosus]AMV61313.1 Hypothetical protein ADU69_1664 [Pediococcus damnosus]AMV62333.1 Hypothetical protein ADU70_0837 [Pediococcus damnosus]AMV65671.1 Hypothetical protein ADU71_1783 [Pediococcus damnosus]AMV67806.1 Hypothetical protein ADU72_1885 [Pediococcus damnosus]AMV70015.1 Hypothetical protein ADU73_1623 [Pediococcus damnosus]